MDEDPKLGVFTWSKGGYELIPGRSEKPTGKLRWINRHHKSPKPSLLPDTIERVLQQQWEIMTYGPLGPTGVDYEWRDVPLEEEKP
jgi:hypothetical protein